MIPSVTTASFFHRESVHDESTVLILLADDMALGPPIYRIIFFVVGVIGLGPLINLLERFTIEFLSLGFVVWILVDRQFFWKTVFLG
jgi:hypothetical protein